MDNECFYVSPEKVTWIEARKYCQAKSAQLLTLNSESKAIKLSNDIKNVAKRHFNEFWTSGNDIEEEGKWVWAGSEGGDNVVPSFGWSEQSFKSVEENCLVWVIEIFSGEVSGGVRVSDGWHGASCCNMHQFVCQYYQ